jgi:hypothetical protein
MNKFNHEHYVDLTANTAIRNVMAEEAECNRLLKTLKYIIGLSGFELVERIQLRNRRSGRVYK